LSESGDVTGGVEAEVVFNDPWKEFEPVLEETIVPFVVRLPPIEA